MKVAHILMVHKDPAQVARLINSMQHPDSYFFIHIDKKVDITPFLHLVKYPLVYFVKKRINVNWGGFSMVKATVNGIEQILGSEVQFDYISLMSGQDYPIKPIGEFISYLTANPDKCFIEYYLPADKWHEEAVPKLTTYHFTDLPVKGRHLLGKIVSKILPKRKMPDSLTLVGRFPYFTIERASAKYIADCFAYRSKLTRFFKYTWGSDEIIFHTLLFNSIFKSKLVNNNLRFTNWPEGRARPETLTLKDADVLSAAETFFARKSDINKDTAILDYIDEKLLKQQPATVLASKRKLGRWR